MSFFKSRQPKKDDLTEIHTNPLKKQLPAAAPTTPPTDEISEQDFAAFLEEMNIPKAQWPMMMNMPVAQKKLLLSQQKSVTKQAQVDDTPQYFVSKLKAEPNMKNLETVSVFIRSKPKSWIIDFIKNEGLETLFSILAQHESKSNKTALEMDLQAECIRCFYGIMNIPEGFKSVVHSKDAAKRIALNLDSVNSAMKLQVMRLLVGICLLDDSGADDGHKLILDAFDNFKLVKRTKHRFSKLVDDLATSTDHEFRSVSLIMINSIVNKAVDLNTRVALRKEFEAAGLPAVLEKVKAWNETDELTQIDIYEESAEEDQAELDQIAPITFDTSDVNAVFQNILRTATESEAHATVLQTLHHILRIPADKKKVADTWAMIEDLVGWSVTQATSAGDRKTGSMGTGERSSSRTMFQDKAALYESIRKVQELEKVITNQRKAVQTAERRLEEVTKEANDKAQVEVKELQEQLRIASDELEKLREAPRIEGSAEALLPMQKKVEELEASVAQLEREKKELQEQLVIAREASDLPPPRPRVGSRPPPPSPPLLSESILGEPQVPVHSPVTQPVRRGGPPPPPDDTSPSPTPARRGGAPPPPPMPDAGATQSSSPVGGLGAALANAAARRGGAPPPPPMPEGASSPSAAPRRGGPPPPPPPMPDDSAASPGAVRRGGPPPPPPPGGDGAGAVRRGGPPPPPPPGDAPAGAVRRGGPGPPPPPPMPGDGPVRRGPPGPPPMMQAVPARPKKPAIKPGAKMRSLGWNKLPDNKIDNTVWEKADDAKIIEQLDTSELDELFGQKETVKAQVVQETPVAEQSGPKPGSVQLLDAKRTQNVSIMMTLFQKMSYEDIAKSVIQLDQGTLTLEQAKGLLKECPTAEELELVTSYEEDEILLNKPERLFRALSVIPRLQQRLTLEVARQTFDAQLSEIKEVISTVTSASKEILESKKLTKMLEIILGIGNYLNGSTFRGGAYGFKIDTLAKLAETKGTKPGFTLMNYLVDYCEKKFPDVVDFASELAHVTPATKVSVATLPVDIRELCKPIDQLKNELTAVTRVKLPEGDRFVACFTPFYEQASKAVAQLQKDNDDREAICKKMIAFFGEDKITPDEMFGHISTFITLFEQAAQANKAEKEKQERAAKRAADAALRKQPSSMMSPTQTTGSDGVMDDLFSSAKSGAHFRRTIKPAAQAAVASEAMSMLSRLRKTPQ